MYKVLYIPLDDRCCNSYYPKLLSEITDDITLRTPPKEIIGVLKKPADIDALWQWIFDNADGALYAILSVDMLVYGNLVNSRIHESSMEEINACLKMFEKLKSAFPELKIHAFNLVTRVAAYDDSFEDPDYWAQYGRRIWKYGWLTDRCDRGLSDETGIKERTALKKEIPADILSDFLSRRRKNEHVNNACIDLTAKGVFDALVIPKDDTAEYGYAATVQRSVYQRIAELNLFDRVMIYPGADEVGSVLFARVFNLIKKYTPRLYVRYSSVLGPAIVPLYEDRPLAESVKAQITSAGGIMVENAAQSDMLFAINSPGKAMTECGDQQQKDISEVTHKCIHEFLSYIRYYTDEYGKPAGIADVAYANGADLDMMAQAHKTGILEKITAYGGWNTAENTNGLCLAHLIIHSYYARNGFSAEKSVLSQAFLARKIFEDYLYQGIISYKLSAEYEALGAFPAKDEICKRACSELLAMIDSEFNGMFMGKKVCISDFRLPWGRLFDIGFTLKLLLRQLTVGNICIEDQLPE